MRTLSRLVWIILTLIFIVGVAMTFKTIQPYIPVQLANITSYKNGFYVDQAVFWGIGAGLLVAGAIVWWAKNEEIW